MEDAMLEFERERKFLLASDAWKKIPASKVLCIDQGYLLIDPERGICRVRLNYTMPGMDFESARLEVKLHATSQGVPEISGEDLSKMTALKYREFCASRIVVKFRHYIDHNGLMFHVDDFVVRGTEPLVLIELEHEDPTSIQRRMLPAWVGKEVTGNHYYDNVAIAQR